MIQPTVTVEGGLLRRVLRLAPMRAFEATRGAFREIMHGFHARFTKERLSKPGGTGGRHRDPRPGVFARTGSLRRAFVMRVTGDTMQTIVGEAGFIDPFAAKIATVHEKGATITPKRAQFLKVPLPGALTPAGAIKAAALSRAGTFVIKGKSGTPVIMSAKGVPIFALKKSVRLPPRLGFVRFWREDQALDRFRRDVLRRRLEAAIKRAG
jgi:hypothetical protein